ncbi:MotA/TolQ/ExbB proton channel family protein [Butyricicoccus faecihominis]|uniref:motility protein A n=1 Tax=Butyricicoccaceae TaxID=3085642 RepID=UPI0024798C34|nr:MotA/TolQ/ExbB proton channel family protein [Agathobaculum sp. NTUH-O15-33]MCQ5130662.1 MotA/TolQ/ExbB proton channel family protein [Butyricicoccus faecihominis]WNX84811.1 MotA/TolQ/ExbB proton channel family protein [Agathobaculum sp. NTUH-O15-33]
MRKKSDLMSIFGLILAVCVMVIGIMLVQTDEGFHMEPLRLKMFRDLPSVFIVLGGTLGVLMISFPLSQLTKIPKHLSIIFHPTQYDPQQYIETLVECAKKARINGLLALEEELDGMEDTFLRASLLMVVDSVDPEKVKAQLAAWMDNMEERHASERTFYEKGAAYAPAFGMIGTLIGLINMMDKLQEVESVGPNMAVALVTTFYGSILSNVVFMPIANKLRVRHEEEYLCKLIICEGVEAIQAGENPKFIEERLTNILPVYRQQKLDEQGEEAGSGRSRKTRG